MKHRRTAILALALAVPAGCGDSAPPVVSAASQACPDVRGIVGAYRCSGECVVTESSSAEKSLIRVDGETDTISVFPGSDNKLYRVDILGPPGDDPRFSEEEIGALSGRVLRTATARVSDKMYPVLEEYVFDVDGECRATGYTKLVRNPSYAGFKACHIRCSK